MSVEACADLVARADPDRFTATMAAPPTYRGDLFALYAFNIEVSRAPYVTQEPLIAQMRLQWWLDAIDEIEADTPVRSHEVTVPLAQTVRARGLNTSRLRQMVEARYHDIEPAPFPDLPHLWSYLDPATGGLMVLAASCFGFQDDPEAGVSGVHSFARADAIARYLRAVPQIEAKGAAALPGDAGRRELAKMGLEALDMARRFGVDRAHRPALWAGWWCENYLRRTAAGKPGERSPIGRKAALLYRSLTGGF